MSLNTQTMRDMKRTHFCAVILALAWLLVVSPAAPGQAPPLPDDPNLVLEDPLLKDHNLLEEPHQPGTIEGTGTCFEVTDSNYIDITFESSEPVHLRLESVPKMIVMVMEVASAANSSEITLGGFEPDTTYYKYQDGYHNKVAFTTDPNGSYAYLQDLTERHLVFIQPQPSTIALSDTGWSAPVGTWDPVTKTATLTETVYETIYITSDGITLDGNGFSAIGSGTGFGVQLFGRTGVTIKNLTVQGFSYGIMFRSSSNTTLTDNMVLNNSWNGIGISGIFGGGSNNNTLTGNTVSNNGGEGIVLTESAGCTLTTNSVSNNGWAGIHLTGSVNSALTNNTVVNSVSVGIYLSNSSGSTLRNNTISGNRWNFFSDAGPV